MSGESGKARENRLRRRRSSGAEKDTSAGHRPDLKTPSRSRSGAGFCGESPYNESGDIQEDIIWDCTSPSPRRLGKRGRRVAAGAVNVSDIVSRIAPEHGRPRIMEPALQQWIGDSAAIPCTPDVQPPKRRSPRLNAVDDLLKLAKQFDFNMLHEEHDRSLELLSDKADDEVVPVVVNAENQTPLDCFSDEEFDLMFDGPTQSMSGALSQGLSAQKTSQDVSNKTQLDSTSKTSVHFSGTKQTENTKTSANKCSTALHQNPTQNLKVVQSSAINPSSNVSGARSSEQNLITKPQVKSSTCSPAINPNEHLQNNPATVQSFDFEDDWDDDGLMDDSLLIEMTQNPHNFTAPKSTSTQKNAPGFKTEKTRQTFKLSSNKDFSAILEKTTAPATSKTISDQNKLNLNTTATKDYSNPAKSMSHFAKSSNSKCSRTPQTSVTNKASVDGFSGVTQTLPSFTNKMQSFSKPQTDFSSRPHQDKAQSATVNTSSNVSRTRSEQSLSHNTSSDASSNRSAASRSGSFRTNSATTHKVEKSPFSNGTKSSQSRATTSRNFTKTLPMDVQSNSTTATSVNSFGNPSATRMGQNITSSHGLGTRSEPFPNNNSSFNIKNTTSDSKTSQNVLKAPSLNALATRLEQNPRSKSVSSNGLNPKMSQTVKNPSIKSVNGGNIYPTDPGLSSSNVSPDFFEDDLDSIFSSEPLWDDPADDDLLCELCDDVENQIQKEVKASERPPLGQRSNQTLGDNRALQQNNSEVKKTPTQNCSSTAKRQEFTFKKPNPFSAEGSRPVGKCSAAEIELKKQQAMERRRRRLQATNNLRAPT